ncbi:fimbrial protein [Kosakonia sp. 1610]|uniref:fimbrial protein n=1 Tax=Kosakonia sp. 1610 TaxID=3156426 RepID=UPI003D25D4F9
MIMEAKKHSMGRLNNALFYLMFFVCSGATFSNAAFAADTIIKANIVEPTCEVAVTTSNIVFEKKNVGDFATGAAEIQPLNINLSCKYTAGLSPSLKITGDSAGLADPNVFRSANSTSQYAGFLLKKGVLSDIASFYGADGTVTPGMVIQLDADNGDSVQRFSVGLVRSAGDPMLTAGTVNAKITFAFVFP